MKRVNEKALQSSPSINLMPQVGMSIKIFARFHLAGAGCEIKR